MSNVIQKLLEGCPDFPTVQDIADEKEPEVFLNRDEGEEACRTVLPGDSLDGHFYEGTMEPNPYLYVPYSKLKVMLETATGEERTLMYKAIGMQSRA